MSGGHFDYGQYKITTIADSIQSELDRQGAPKPEDELWGDPEFYKKYPEELLYPTYPDKVKEIMETGVKVLRLAGIYAQRIDWFLSGDDGEESLVKRLYEELRKLNENGQ